MGLLNFPNILQESNDQHRIHEFNLEFYAAPRTRPVPISDLVPDTDLMDSRCDDVDNYAPRHDFLAGPYQRGFLCAHIDK